MEKKNTVPMLEKALDLLEYIGASDSPVTLPELQKNLGIAQASCYRIASTLLQRGWLEKRSGNRYEIAPGISRAAEKVRFRAEHYKRLQPAMNILANQIGFSAKFSVRDGDEFVNVCSAQCRTGLLNFSEPGFRSPLRTIASVSAVFLAESPLREQKRLLDAKTRPVFLELKKQYSKYGCCYIHGQLKKDADYPFDTLSIPVKREELLLGVISFLSLPGELEKEKETIVARTQSALRGIANSL